jgi:membrane protease YdiL (CAAX protease family)
MNAKVVIIALLVLILLTGLIMEFTLLHNEVDVLYQELELQLVINQKQEAFNQIVIEEAVTRGMLQGALDNFYSYLIEQLMQ